MACAGYRLIMIVSTEDLALKITMTSMTSWMLRRIVIVQSLDRTQ